MEEASDNHFSEGVWVWSSPHQAVGKVIERIALWGEENYRIWLPQTDSVVRVTRAEVSAARSSAPSSDYIHYIAAAGRVADELAQNTSSGDGVLLAPMEASVIPLPHQVRALSRAISGDRIRYLLADEVGLGKTIEAGLILRELKMRGLARRVLVVAPKGLVTQWVAEMETHFNETFEVVAPQDLSALRKLSGAGFQPANQPANSSMQPQQPAGSRLHNPWSLLPQIVVPMDSVKPMDNRQGWTTEQVAEFNRERFEDLIGAGWDLVIVDEAHRLGGSTEQVARYKLGQGLGEAAPYLLLLSATPHQGKTDAFSRLVSLLDKEAFPDEENLIFKDFGIDKTEDVLDSAQANQIFDELYIEALIHPESVEEAVDGVARQVAEQAKESKESEGLLAEEEEVRPEEAKRMLTHPLRYWVEAMTIAYLRSAGTTGVGNVGEQGDPREGKSAGAIVRQEKDGHRIWRLKWPDGTEMEGCFTRNGDRFPQLSLEEPRIRALIERLPRFAPGLPVPEVRINGLPKGVEGVWSLWSVGIETEAETRRRIFPLFRHTDGRVLAPTARHIWEELVQAGVDREWDEENPKVNVLGTIGRDETNAMTDALQSLARKEGEALFTGLARKHREHLERERGKGEHAFSVRRSSIERVGLPEVRQHRFGLLQEEERAWKEALERRKRILPELNPLLLLKIVQEEGRSRDE